MFELMKVCAQVRDINWRDSYGDHHSSLLPTSFYQPLRETPTYNQKYISAAMSGANSDNRKRALPQYCVGRAG